MSQQTRTQNKCKSFNRLSQKSLLQLMLLSKNDSGGTHLNLNLICGKTLAWYCPSRTAESKCGSSQDLVAARSNATGSITLQQECRRPFCVRYVWMYGASEIWISSTDPFRLSDSTGGIVVNEIEPWRYDVDWK